MQIRARCLASRGRLISQMRRLQGGSHMADRLEDNSIRQIVIASASGDSFGVGAES